MFRQENLVDLITHGDESLFRALSRDMSCCGQGYVLKGQKYSFVYLEMPDHYFAQDVFLQNNTAGISLFIGGARQCVDGISEEVYFITNAIAMWKWFDGLVMLEAASQAEKIHVMQLDCKNPDPTVLKFLLTTLPVLASERGYLEIEKGDNWFSIQGDAESSTVNICLRSSHDLRLRRSKKHADQWRLAVINRKAFASGKYSQAHQNLSIFRFNAEQSVITTTKPRVYKRFQPDETRLYDPKYRYAFSRMDTLLATESAILQKIPYLKSTKIYEENYTYYAYSHFEALLPGVPLEDWVTPKYFLQDIEAENGLTQILAKDALRILDHAEINPEAASALVIQRPLIESYSAMHRIALCIALIDALMVVHGAEVIHGDIKPSNILVSENAGKFVAYFVDFNLSRVASDLSLNERPIGTPIYWSPESLVDKVPQYAADVFSLGIVLGRVFGATLHHFKEEADIKAMLESQYAFVNLFDRVADLTPHQRNQAGGLLHAAVALHRGLRPTLQALREGFQALLAPKVEAEPLAENAPARRPGV